MTRPTRARRLATVVATVLLGLGATAARAQSEAEVPADAKMAAIFSPANRAALCGTASAERPVNVRPAVVLGELARQYDINLFALPPNPRLGTPDIPERDIPDTVEARAAAWIIEAGNGTAAQVGLEPNQHRALILMAAALRRYLEWAAAPPQRHPYQTSQLPIGRSSRPSDLMLAFFKPLLGVGAAQDVALICRAAPSEIAGGGDAGAGAGAPGRGAGPRAGSGAPPASFAVRGQIDDLVARRGTEDFKKASAATLSFTDNNEAGTTSFAISGVVALGANFGRDDALYGFVQYTRNDNETDVAGDDDDSKDVHSISPGIFYRHPLALGHSVVGTLGLTGYGTFDLRNDAELIRARLVYSDISVWLGRGRGILCGSQRALLFLYADCRLSAFIEAAEVLDAGTNADLLANADDEYLGAGGEASLILSPRGPALLRPLSFRATYRAMGILSGELDDPERLELAINYAIPLGPPAGGPGLTFGISRIIGENFETFQHENLWKLTLGFKF